MSALRDLLTISRVTLRSGLWRGTPEGAAAVCRELLRGRRDWLVAAARHARDRPEQLALCDAEESLDWATLHARTQRVAAGLAELGVQPGQRVAIALRNRTAHVVASGAAAQLGAVVAPMSSSSGPSEVRERLRRCAVAVVEPHLAEDAAVGLGARWRAIVHHDAPRGTTPWLHLLASARPAPRGVPRRDAPDAVLYTSGTTGRSKGSRISSRDAKPATAFRYIDALSLSSSSVFWTPCPLYHAAPFALAGLTFILGGTVIVDDRFEERQAVDRISDAGVTHAFLVPALAARLARLPDAEVRRLRQSDLSALVSSGAPLRPELKSRLQSLLGPVLYDLYGATELGLVAIGSPADNAVRPEAVGRVLPGLQTELRDAAGDRVPSGTRGELYVQSDTVSPGYDDEPSSPGHQRWGRSGDLARLDAHGFLHVVGRVRDMVVSGGVNIFPAEVEAVLAAHPSVLDVAVAGVPDERWGEAVHAWVVTQGTPPSLNDLKAWVRAQLAAYKAPRVIHLVDALPRTPTGKVLKRELVAAL